MIRKAQPVPIAAMTTPETAGPIIRAALNEVEFSATALCRSSSPDQFRDESLAHRRVERRRAAEQEGEDIDMPELDDAGDGEERPAPGRGRPSSPAWRSAACAG